MCQPRPPGTEAKMYRAWLFLLLKQPTSKVSTPLILFFLSGGLVNTPCSPNMPGAYLFFICLWLIKATDVGGWQELSTLLP